MYEQKTGFKKSKRGDRSLQRLPNQNQDDDMPTQGKRAFLFPDSRGGRGNALVVSVLGKAWEYQGFV